MTIFPLVARHCCMWEGTLTSRILSPCQSVNSEHKLIATLSSRFILRGYDADVTQRTPIIPVMREWFSDVSDSAKLFTRTLLYGAFA
jgi:hypothetical protein